MLEFKLLKNTKIVNKKFYFNKKSNRKYMFKSC